MRLIDADALLKVFADSEHIKETESGLDIMEMLAIKEIIDNAPTALFPLTVKINDNVTDEDIETLKRLMTDYKPQVLNLERPQGEYTEEDIKYAIKESFDLGYEMAKNKYARPQGEWEKCQNDMFRCSICRQADEVPTVMGIPIYNFCPSCGADMRKGGAE